MLDIDCSVEEWPLAQEFRISRGSKDRSRVLVATISDGANMGYGECLPYPRYNESTDSVQSQIEAISHSLDEIPDRNTLRNIMPPGAARNALDCAILDLNCKQQQRRAWEVLGITQPAAVTTAYTLGIDSVDNMAANARQNRQRQLLKIKLGPVDASESVTAIHREAPDSRLIVDANEAWTLSQLDQAMEAFCRCQVEMVEQPLPANNDQELSGVDFPIPIGADESCHTPDKLDTLVGKYQVINIKLDKTGGITEALHLKTKARNLGMDIMVGCMVSTSLSMAPAMLLTEDVRWVDLDGPLLLKKDRPNGLKYAGSEVHPPSADLWG